MLKKLVVWVVLLGVVLGALGALAPAVLAAGSSQDPTQNMPQAPSIPEAGEGQKRLIDILHNVVNFLWAIAGVVAMIFVIIHGYKIITSIDPRERADAMRGLIHALLGLGIIFGSWVIVRVIIGIVLGQPTK
jgi:hypothetical protein